MNAAVKLPSSPRAIALVLLGLAVVVAAAGWFVIVSPKRSHASKLAAEIGTKQAAVAAAEHAQASAQGAVSGRGAAEALPDVPGMPQVVDQLNRLADRAGVTLDTVTPQSTVAGTGYVTVPMNVVVDGHYYSVEQFLHLVRTQVRFDKAHLKATGRLFDVEGVSLQQTEPAPMVTATLNLSTFYYSPTATAPAPAPTTTTADATSPS